MPRLEIDDLINDPDFTSEGLVYWRSTTKENTDGIPTILKNRYDLIGIITPMKTRELQRMPEGFNTTGAMSVITATRLSAGDARNHENADQVIWKNSLYLVKSVDDYNEWGEGFFVAYCELQGINTL